MVMLLINDVWIRTIIQDTITIDRIANDPVPTFKIRIKDDPSHIAISELMEVIFIDEYQIANPTHNLIVNPLISPNATNYTQITATGGSIADLSPGVQFTASNATGSFGLTQNTQPGLITANQQYMLSCTVATGTLTNCNAYLSITFLNAAGTSLGTQATNIGSGVSATRFTVQGTAPNGAMTIQIGLGMNKTNATNSGTSTFTSIQLEPMSFISGNYQLSYPTPWAATGQINCTVLPDGTTIRQYRLFGGYITKATAGDYIGNNRKWSVQVSGYAWLLQKQQLNDTWTTQTDNFIINAIVTKYFLKTFSTAQVVTGATLDAFGYQYTGTARDAFNALAANANYIIYIDAYRVIWFQPAGYNMLGFILSDSPDNITSFPYYNYSLDTDGTQIGNATLVTGASNISAIEYDGASIAYYNVLTNGQGTFWRTVNDSSITTTTAAQQRAIAENATYNYGLKVAHLSTQQLMIPGYTVLFSSVTDGLFKVPFLVQKASLVLLGMSEKAFRQPVYEFQCDLGPFQPNLTNVITKILRKQQISTSSIGTPVPGLMVTEHMTFIDSIQITRVVYNPSIYGTGIYGTNTYQASFPGVPTTVYGTGTWGDSAKGYN